MKGLLIVNGYMRTQKFEEITNLYENASKNYGMKLDVCYTDNIAYGLNAKGELYINLDLSEIKFVLFLDKDVMLARHLEKLGLRVFNTAEAIELCDHKGKTMAALGSKGIAMPKTLMAPLIFEGMYNKDVEDLYIKHIEKEFDYPFILKECYGSFGMQVYKVDNRCELLALRAKIADKPHLYQAYVKSSEGRDVRIHVVGGKVVASMLRINKNDFRANITNGGKMEVYHPTNDFEKLAIKACEALGLDFAGVDLLFGKENKPVLCEVNSNAHIKNILDLTGINIAEKIMEYIEEEVAKA